MTNLITNKDFYTLEDMSSGENKSAFEAFSTSTRFRGESRNRSNEGYECFARSRLCEVAEQVPELAGSILKECHLSEGNPRSILALGCANKRLSAAVNKYADDSFSSLFDPGIDSARVCLPSISCHTVSVLKNNRHFDERRYGRDRHTPNQLALTKSDSSCLSHQEKLILAGIKEFNKRFDAATLEKIDSMLTHVIVRQKPVDIDMLNDCGFSQEESEKIILIANDPVIRDFAERSGEINVMKGLIFEIVVTGYSELEQTLKKESI